MSKDNDMTNIKKTPGRVVTVDAGKLSRGLKITFEGMAMVFDSLGVEEDLSMENKQENKTPEKERAEKETAAEGCTGEKAVSEKVNENVLPDAGPAGNDTSVDVPADGPSGGPAEGNREASVAPAVSLDDVTKVIVQKIKQDRCNNEKIGHILKTYGASRVGKLDPGKFEAFLTDLAAL